MSLDKYELLNRECKELKKQMRVAAYCRVSTDNRDQANSFESQQKFFKQYIENHPDWELYEVFADQGVSGTSINKRKEFKRMIESAENYEFDLIITKEISRFARNTGDSIEYTRRLKKHGVGVIFLNDNIDTRDPDSELRLTIMASLAQDESRRTSERVKWGQKIRMEDGVVFGRDLLGYDVRGGKLYVNEEGAKIVRLIFHKFVNENKGTWTIAREFREEGILPMRVKEWSNTVILRTLRNEKYCGDLVQQKTYTPDFLTHEKKYNRGEREFVIIRNHHEPIVSREMFEKANKILDERSDSLKGKGKHSNRYPFSGKITCGQCGCNFVARYKKRKDGSQYKGWRCAEASKHGKPHIDKAGNSVGCSNSTLRNEDAIYIMYLVTKHLKCNKIKIADNLIKIIKNVLTSSRFTQDVEKIKEKLNTEIEKKNKLLDLYINGTISKEEFINSRDKIEQTIETLNTEINSIEFGKTVKIEKEKLFEDIKKTIYELADGVFYEDEFYKQILDRIVVLDKNNVDVYLSILPGKWHFTLSKTLAPNLNGSIFDTPVPISVSVPFNSGIGIENRWLKYLSEAPNSPSGPPYFKRW